MATVIICMFTDLFLYGLIIPIIPFILHDRIGLSGDIDLQAYTSLLLSSYAGAAAFFVPICGYISDLVPQRREIFLVGLLCLFISTVMTAMGQSLVVLFAGRILGGLSAALVWPVGIALIMDTVGADRLGVALGTVFSIVGMAEIIAPVVGGVLYHTIGPIAVFSISFFAIGIDFFMRLLLIEKKVALQKHGIYDDAVDDARDEEQDELSSLLSNNKHQDQWKISDDRSMLLQKLPILCFLKNPNFIAALVLQFVMATLFGTYDATLPTEALKLFHVNPLQAGLIFIPVCLPGMLLGPLAGKLIDKFGGKPMAVIGFLWPIPALLCLRIPQEGGIDEMIKMAVILSFAGMANGLFGGSPTVELTRIVGLYHKANPELFGEQGPYCQSYALGSLTYSLGLTVGPILAGGLRETIGFGNMMAVLACMCGATSVLSYYYIGDPSEWPRRKRR